MRAPRRAPAAAAFLAVAMALSVAPSGCGDGGTREGAAGPATDARAFASADRVPVRSAATASAPSVTTLARDTEVAVVGREGAFLRVKLPSGAEGWVAGDGLERSADREARERRTKAVARFATVPGRVVASCPVLLAPDYGAARWGTLEEGDPVDVVVADPDFFGVRLLGIPLAFVPSQAVRFVVPGPPPVAAAAPMPVPAAVAPPAPPASAGPGAVTLPFAEERERGSAPEEPYAALPAGALPPELESRVDPAYPDMARRAGIGGEVVLRVVVERDGSVGRVEPIQEAPAGLTEAAADAVRRWRYRPATLGGSPIAVVKTVRVRFSPAPGR